LLTYFLLIFLNALLIKCLEISGIRFSFLGVAIVPNLNSLWNRFYSVFKG